MDVMADLAASQEFNLELVAVSTDSIPVHRWVAVRKRLSLFVRVWRERREGGGPMIMLADMTGEVPRYSANLLRSFLISGVSQLWSVGHWISPRLQRPLCR